ncbi:MAG: MFS transporter [Phycisphaerales bacterium]
MPGTDAHPRHDPFAAVRSGNYVLYALAFLCSSFGLQMSGMALGWEVYERTHDAFLLGLMGVARALPVVLMALPAGQVVDSLRRQRVVMVTQLGFGVVLALLALATRREGAGVSLILGLVSLMGFVRTFNGPSRSSLLPDLVPEGVFQNAITWNVGLFQFSAVAGPLAAGWMIDRWHTSWQVFAGASLLCVASSVFASFLTPMREGTPGAMTLTGLREGIMAGLHHVRREKLILSTITLDLFAVLLGGATGLLPVYAKDILHVGAVGLGWLRAATFLGALAMSLVLAWRPIRRHAGPMLLWSVAGFGVATIVFGLSTSFWLSMAMLLIAGAVDNISVVIRHVLVQTRTPANLRGRVSAVNSVFIECSNELGSFESGAVAKLFGPVASVVSGGVGTILVVLGVATVWHEVRTLDRLEK